MLTVFLKRIVCTKNPKFNVIFLIYNRNYYYYYYYMNIINNNKKILNLKLNFDHRSLLAHRHFNTTITLLNNNSSNRSNNNSNNQHNIGNIDVSNRTNKDNTTTTSASNNNIRLNEFTKIDKNQHKKEEIMNKNPMAINNIFKSVRDRYNGILVDSKTIEIDQDNFEEILEATIDYWKDNAGNTFWFKVNVNNSNFVPILAKHGFNYHHAREGFVMMYKWLPIHISPNIPPYAHTMVGVGGLVINKQNQVLTITEKQSIIPGNWKLPGGYVEPNENLVDAVKREVFEETGIHTQFDSLISIRHAHGFNFNCSDLYIVISLIPEENDDIKLCPREIAQSKWMDFDEYLNHPKVHETNRSFLRNYIAYKQNGIRIECADAVHELLRRKYNLYFVSPKM